MKPIHAIYIKRIIDTPPSLMLQHICSHWNAWHLISLDDKTRASLLSLQKSGTPVMLLELWGSQVVLHSEKQSKYLKKSYIEVGGCLERKSLKSQIPTVQKCNFFKSMLHLASIFIV